VVRSWFIELERFERGWLNDVRDSLSGIEARPNTLNCIGSLILLR
jgi:hypothetical protein